MFWEFFMRCFHFFGCAFSLTLVHLSSVASGIDSVRTLDADGPNQGKTAYELIRTFGGNRAIESPDLYPDNHPGKPHIYEAIDDIVGSHFVFTMHRDHDKDRGKHNITDRQRNEIKAYDKSERALKAYYGDTFEYRWKFKVNKDFDVSKNFTHLFQLKSVDNGIGTPILALTGRGKNNIEVMELGHVPVDKKTRLARVDLADFKDQWISVICNVTYHEQGSISFNATRLSDNKALINVNTQNVDTWRGTEPEHFVRPKWGIYRSLRDE